MDNNSFSKMYDDFFGNGLVNNTSFEKYLKEEPKEDNPVKKEDINIDNILLSINSSLLKLTPSKPINSTITSPSVTSSHSISTKSFMLISSFKIFIMVSLSLIILYYTLIKFTR